MTASGSIACPSRPLVSALRPRPLSHHLERAARRAAERAQGLPGRFVRLVWPQALAGDGDDRPSMRRGLPRVAERPAVYGREDAPDDLFVAPASVCEWPAPGELTALRRRRDAAVVHLTHGRHAPGLRQLRQAIGGLARRSDWANAADGALALAGPLLRRGRARDALAAIDEGRQYARRSGRDGVLVDLATLNGEAWIDLARLDEAESVLATALATARAARDPARVAAASVTLARCLYWRGQYPEAEAALGSCPDDLAVLRVRHALLAARIAVGLRDLNRAMSLVLAAGEWASADGSAASRAAVSFTAALVHLAVGDLDAVERDVVRIDCRGPCRARSAARHPRPPPPGGGGAPARPARCRRGAVAAPSTGDGDDARRRCGPDGSSARRSRGGMAIRRKLVAQRVAATGLGALGLYASDPRVVVGIVAPDRCLRRRARRDPARLPGGGGRGRRAEGRLRSRPAAPAGGGGRLPRGARETDRHRLRRRRPARHGDRGTGRGPGAHHRAAQTRRSDRGGGAGPVRRPADRCSLRALDAGDDRRHVARRLGADDERRRGGADAGGDHRAAAAGGRRRRRRAAGRDAGDGRAQTQHRARGGGPVRGADRRREREREGAGRARDSPRRVAARSRRSARSTVPRCPTISSRPSSSATRAARSPARSPSAPACSRKRTAARSFSTRSASCRRGRRRRCCASSRKASCAASARTCRGASTSGSSRPPIAICAARWTPGGSGSTCCTGSTSSASPCRRCAIAARTSPCWPNISGARRPHASAAARHSASTTIAALARYDWPGNVRELQNVLAALAVRSPRRGVIPPSALPAPFGAAAAGADAARLDEARRTFEERFVRAALVRTGGHRGRAAAELGVTRQGLTKLMTRLGISP